MSLFGLGGGLATAGMEVNQERMELAQQELEILMGLHDSIVTTCQEKCFVPYYAESDLTKGETCCLDRCVSKFFKANTIIGQLLQNRDASSTLLPSGAVLPTLGQHKLP